MGRNYVIAFILRQNNSIKITLFPSTLNTIINKLIGNNRYYSRVPIIAKLHITHNNAVSSTPSHERGPKFILLVVTGTDCTGSCKFNYQYDHDHEGPHNYKWVKSIT